MLEFVSCNQNKLFDTLFKITEFASIYPYEKTEKEQNADMEKRGIFLLFLEILWNVWYEKQWKFTDKKEDKKKVLPIDVLAG